MSLSVRTFLALAFAAFASAAAAQVPVQSSGEALAQDAAEYARQHEVSPDEALLRLRAQEESVAATDRLRTRFAKRLAGISIEHQPSYQIVVLLTGKRRPPDQAIAAGGLTVPVTFRTGAPATRERLLKAIEERGDALRAAFPAARGMGVDPRTGELVLMLSQSDKAYDLPAVSARIAEIAGVPARARLIDQPEANLAAEGGARVEGTDTVSGRHAVCTAGFLVSDGARFGLVTAAHCPDVLTYVDPAGTRTELPFVGQWGWSFQDVQVNETQGPAEPLFYADARKTAARSPSAQRTRASTRAGDFVCHRGERTGYSCAEVALTDYAPPGELCGGPCAPVWVAVEGPGCGGGDSGGPVFLGDTAFGIMKGGSWVSGGRCAFYYYMSLDYLPDGWSLLTRPEAASPQPAPRSPPDALPTPSTDPMSPPTMK
jgi:streptogrisin C